MDNLAWNYNLLTLCNSPFYIAFFDADVNICDVLCVKEYSRMEWQFPSNSFLFQNSHINYRQTKLLSIFPSLSPNSSPWSNTGLLMHFYRLYFRWCFSVKMLFGEFCIKTVPLLVKCLVSNFVFVSLRVQNNLHDIL